VSAGDALSQSAPGQVATRHVTQEQQPSGIGGGCPACQAERVPGAAFCVECGHALGCPCPQCGAEVGGCEFCESCGLWLKPGQCRFCYAETIEGATYCTECGNDQNGMRCKRCDRVGFFDFCSQCGDPVSELARELDQAPDNPVLAEALGALRALDAADRQAAQRLPPRTPTVSARTAAPAPRPELNLAGALRSMRAFAVQDAAGAEKARQQAALDRQAERARAQVVAAEQAAEPSAQAEAEQEARRQEMADSEGGAMTRKLAHALSREGQIEALMKALQALGRQSFSDHQEARREHMAIRQRMARLGISVWGWRCNTWEVTHDSPNDCGVAQGGGEWVIKTLR
jgi:hypothetical protein